MKIPIQLKKAALGFEPRITVLQTVALVHLAMPPPFQKIYDTIKEKVRQEVF